MKEVAGSSPAGSTRVLGPWYTGNMLPWHGRVAGSIPAGSTKTYSLVAINLGFWYNSLPPPIG